MLDVSILALFLCISPWGLFVRSIRTIPPEVNYDIFRPQKLSSRTKRSLPGKQAYPENLQYALNIKGNNYTVHLEKNQFLLGKNYIETYYLDNGTEVTTSPNIEEHCYYQGHIQDIEDSSVSIGICSGMRGFVRAKQEVYLIEPLANSLDGDHAVYRQEHARGKRSSCGLTNDTVYDYGPKVSGLYAPNGWKSKPFVGEGKFIEMFMVVDNTEYKTFQGNMKNIKDRMLEIANHVDKLYRPLNIRVMLVGLEVWSNGDKIDVSTDPNETLKRFIQWRSNSLLKKTKHDNVQLVTGVDFDGNTVGLANKFAMCDDASGAVNQDHNTNPIGVASTIAHEMGHNLGLSHDGPNCACSTSVFKKNCIMADRVGSIFPEVFSSCSQAELSAFLENANPSCLDYPGSDRLFGGPVCGNAFLDPGEECDCGTVEECRNPCCNAATCRLTEGAQCAEGVCCENCQLKQAGSLCRKGADECDLAEYCSGSTPHCPKDVFKMNGLPCNYNQGFCYNGQCPTLLQHCRKLWGSDSDIAADVCFHQNRIGSPDAYCKKTTNGYQGCAQQDMKCGKIFCTGGNEFPITGRKTILTVHGRKCNIAVHQSETEDVGMVPTGTRCGTNKVCYENMCQDVKVYGTDECSAKCNSHGVCNHERQCHCEPGWAPPYCNVKYSDLTQGSNVVAIVVSVVVTVLLLTLVTGGLMCCRKSKKQRHSSKKHVSAVSSLSNPIFSESRMKRGPHCGTPQISLPVFLESSAPQANTPLFVKVGNSQSSSETKPPPPKRPLPPVIAKQDCKQKLLPPVPPVKPTESKAHGNHPQAAAVGPKVALKPPAAPR